ncbi:hypothetical protein NliqN6_5143 [Naganishia liquefaciens]|uniref:Ankyrin repeat domain-containing protein n=1 Tax=Naganishia liquefaciens TaxID=104408 RepID=A0A8H3TW90_9TREE|nr:hypothetical protein NliqN6_5143 [Naganishia liquefaciens]
MPSLGDLPPELLYEIHHLSLSEHLPLATRYLHAVLAHPTPLRAAHWLIAKYHPPSATADTSRFLSRALECGVCELDVLAHIERIFALERDAAAPDHPTPWFHLTSSKATLLCPTLPKRIFRPRSTASHITHPTHPLLTHLLTTYRSSPNSHRGYPLSRAVLAADIPLITLLLRAGADPAQRDHLAVEIALKRRDLASLRLLLDGPPSDTTDAPRPAKRRKHTRSEPASVSGVRLSQALVDTALTKGTPEIIHYIIHEKGYMPSLRSIVKLK